MSLHLAVFLPLAPCHTDLAHRWEALLSCLARDASIDLFVGKGYTPVDPRAAKQFTIHNHRSLSERVDAYDGLLYVLGGDDDQASDLLATMSRYPGIAILDGTVLDFTLGQDPELTERIVSSSLGIIVPSSYARRQLHGRHPGCRVASIPVPFYLPSGFSSDFDRRALRARWGLDDRFVIGTFEPFASKRQMGICLRAFSNLLGSCPDARYLLCGALPAGYDMAELVRALDLEGKVILAGAMDPISLCQHMCLVDLAMQLQPPTGGGMALVPVRLMGLGIPTIVSDVESLAGLPDGACAKVRPGEYQEATLTEVLDYLAGDDRVRRQMARNGQRYIQAYCSPKRIAEQIREFIHEIVAWEPGALWLAGPLTAREALLRDVGSILAGWGVTEDEDPLLAPLGRAIGDLFALLPQENEERRKLRRGSA
jgi:glycosyltransferase involved in cell wall biosynthesis